MYVLVVSSGAANSADRTTLPARERRTRYSCVNSNTKCQSTADFAFQFENLSNRCSAGIFGVSKTLCLTCFGHERFSVFHISHLFRFEI